MPGIKPTILQPDTVTFADLHAYRHSGGATQTIIVTTVAFLSVGVHELSEAYEWCKVHIITVTNVTILAAGVSCQRHMSDATSTYHHNTHNDVLCAGKQA